MGNFFAELRRRHIYQVTAAYIVVAWALLQLFNNLEPILKLPDWAGTLVLVLLVGGFPIALVFAWTLELKSAPAGTAAARLELKPAGNERKKQSGAPVHPGSFAKQAEIAIAVLPFANMSGDASQEFFSDGMTEEITSALAKVPKLRVVARTSAFQFKSQSRDIPSIGQALHATHLIEGSVRKDGNQVRITAQLIKADDGTHIWTESYNRELRAVFAVQEDIAQAIAASLQMPLGLKQGEQLISNRSIGPESYQQFLRARALVRARGLEHLTEGAALLEQVVARNPNYAPAWALLGFAYASTLNFHPAFTSGVVPELRLLAGSLMPKAEAAAKRAIELDARHADGFVALAHVEGLHSKLVTSETYFLKALELDANDPDALHYYSLVLAGVGRLKDAVAIRRRLQALEPFVPHFNAVTAYFLWVNAQVDEALKILMNLPPDYVWRQFFLSMIYASLGRYDEAANAIEASPTTMLLPETIHSAARLLRMAPQSATAPLALQRLGYLSYVYLYVGQADRVLEAYEGSIEAGYSVAGHMVTLWLPNHAPLRKTERFKALMKKAGIVEYWHAKGWPDICHPITGDDFECN
jgi:adenylate cyclase